MKGKKGSGVIELFARLQAVAQQQALLEEEKAALKQQLGLLIKEGTSKEGVAHLVREHVSVKWSKVHEQVVAELVPSTKRELAQEIVLACTTRSKSHVFEQEKQG